MQNGKRKNTEMRKKQIVEVARKIITSRGMERLTIRMIAKEMNITEGALYRHVRSKVEIMGLLIDEIEQTLLGKIKTVTQQPSVSTEKLESIFYSHLSYAEARRGVSFIVITETLNLHDRALQVKMHAVLSEYLAQIRAIVKEGIADGSISRTTDPESASIMFLGTVQSLVNLWALQGYNRRFIARRKRKLFQHFLNSICLRNLTY
jgi:TetR/AcrR family transcriptional regulator